MPLSFGGRARYNSANIAAASLAAAALGVAPQTIGRVLTEFGVRHEDNVGRLQHWQRNGVEVFIDYAHNVDGLRGLLDIARARRAPGGRLGVLLGQAGNREDAQIRELADVVAEFAPERVVLKDLSQMLRGRTAGEVPALLRVRLLQRGMAEAAIESCLDEEAAACALLEWARPGDVVVLPLHTATVRDAVAARLSQ
jgi:UDP-N-acetylmuramyl tripeptide synthase